MEIDNGFTLEERVQLLRQLSDVEARYFAALEQEDMEEIASTAYKEKKALTKAYWEKIPITALGCCPFDNSPLLHSFDPHGLDGLWWAGPSQAVEPERSPHFCLLRGAVHYRGLPAMAGSTEISPGPEVPYVLPRLMEIPGMVAVIGRVAMTNGYLAYPITYFAKEPPPADQLSASWGLGTYNWVSEDGSRGYGIDNDIWDFDLQPYVEAGKLFWCPPDSENLSLAPAGEACPYVNLSGRRENIRVQGEKISALPLPDGDEVSPYE